MTYRIQFLVMTCALALAVGCTQNKNARQMAAGKGKSPARQQMAGATTRPSGESTASTPGCPDASCDAANPLAGSWQLAIPRRPQREATITATDAEHVTLSAGKTLSGEYVVKGSYLLIVTQDERLRPLAWIINSNDSLTLVRPPDLGPGSAAFKGITLVRSPDDAATAADMGELPAP